MYILFETSVINPSCLVTVLLGLSLCSQYINMDANNNIKNV